MQILWVNKTQKPIPKIFINSCLMQIQKILKSKKIWPSGKKELVLVFVSANEMKKINFNFRKNNNPTDVLSFAPIEDDSLGELLFCPVVLERQAKEAKQAYSWELAYMLLHGTLHLLGFDHESSDKDALEMYRLQDAIFQKMRKSQNVYGNRNRRSQKKPARNRS